MLDPDISTADALRQLSVSEHDPWAIDRRRFLQMVGLGLGAGVVASGPGSSLLDSLTGNEPWAHGAAPVGATDGILVIVGMFGGNDGLNTVVPIGDPNYGAQRSNIAIGPAATLPINATTGLHGELTELKRFWDAGHLAIVEGVGYPNPDLSHFNSMATWMSGFPNGIPTSGWMGRWLDGYLGSSKNLFAAAEIGHSLPLHLVGQVQRGTTVPAGKPAFGAETSAQWNRLYASLRTISAPSVTTWKGRVGQAMVDQLDVAQRLEPIIPGTLPAAEPSAKLEVMARLINANLGFRVMTAGWGDFDSHAGQPGQHGTRMAELNAAIARFFQILSPAWSERVTVMTFSEFGRTSWSNDGRGTDHGTAAPHFVFGSRVRGGMYGQRPTLKGLQRWDRMAHHVDFRDYYGSVIDGWMGGGGATVVGKPVIDLALFLSPDVPSNPPAPAAVAVQPTNGGPSQPGASGLGRFVAVNPDRVFDTRSGVGGRTGRIGPDETVTVPIVGHAGVPDGALAVALNITSTNATDATYFSAFPSGTPVPSSSSLNPQPGRAIPNMAIVGLGGDGGVDIFNRFGLADCIVDVLGYFQPAGGFGLEPLVPERLLDTRVGLGAPAGRVTGGAVVDLQVAGRGGVPAAGADAVVLNVTAVMPSLPGFVTVWPTAQPQPYISNVNYEVGMVIPNLVVCKLGAGGTVSLFVSDGDVDLVADVVGCFTDTGGGLLAALAPHRILDTRTGLGSPLAPVGGGGELVVPVLGAGGVPASARAVVLNLTGTNATSDTYVTSYPSGSARPNASTLNVSAGRTTANLVIVKVGGDGAIRLFNERGTIDLLADVTGYFT